MRLTPVQTSAIRPNTITLDVFVESYVPTIQDRSILAITSKVVSICEGSVVKKGDSTKEELVSSEADYYLPPDSNTYAISLSIKHETLIANAGIDESNGDGYYILWPKDPKASAHSIRTYLMRKHNIAHLGVIITDSRTMPLRWGVFGTSIAHAGFEGLRNYMGTKDIFGRTIVHTQANVAEGLAASAVLMMGEGDECTPVVLIEDVPFVRFTDQPGIIPSVDRETDIYAPMLTSVKWLKGR